jgi:hypothetical protein
VRSFRRPLRADREGLGQWLEHHSPQAFATRTCEGNSSWMTEVEPTACDTRASSAVSFPLRAITAAAPIPIPNSTDKNAVRSSRRKRGMGDNNPNSG